MRGGAYAKAVLTRDASDIPRLKWLVEGMRVVEGMLHSAKRMVSKSEAQRVRVRGDGWRGREAARTRRVVTLLTSQPLISLLKLRQAGLQPRCLLYDSEAAQKTYDKSVTCEISHKLIGP